MGRNDYRFALAAVASALLALVVLVAWPREASEAPTADREHPPGPHSVELVTGDSPTDEGTTQTGAADRTTVHGPDDPVLSHYIDGRLLIADRRGRALPTGIKVEVDGTVHDVPVGADGCFIAQVPPLRAQSKVELRERGFCTVVLSLNPGREEGRWSAGRIELVPAAAVTAEVRDAAGRPAVGVRVRLDRDSTARLTEHRLRGANAAASEATAEGGFACFPRPVALGSWEVETNGGFKFSPESVEIVGDETHLRLTCIELPTIRGIVVDGADRPVAGAWVIANDETGWRSGMSQAATAADGSFEVVASRDPRGQRAVLSLAPLAGHRRPDSRSATTPVSWGSTGVVVRFQFQELPKIEFEVFGPKGRITGKGRVGLRDPAREAAVWHDAVATEDGTWVVTVAQPEMVALRFLPGGSDLGLSDELMVRPGDSTIHRLKVDLCPTIVVQVSRSGDPVPGATISLIAGRSEARPYDLVRAKYGDGIFQWSPKHGNTYGVAAATTDAKGRAVLRVLESGLSGRSMIRAWTEGLAMELPWDGAAEVECKVGERSLTTFAWECGTELRKAGLRLVVVRQGAPAQGQAVQCAGAVRWCTSPRLMEAAELRAHVSVGRQFTVGVLEPVAGSTVALLREPRQPAVLELHVPSRGKSLEILRQDRKGRAWRAPSAGAFRLILEPGVACEVLVDEEVHVRLTCAPGEHRVLRLQ